MTEPERPVGEHRRQMVPLILVVTVGAVSVACIWSALNELSRSSMTLVDGLAGGFGAVAMLALMVWLWRYLSALLPESQHSHRHVTRPQPPPSEEDP